MKQHLASLGSAAKQANAIALALLGLVALVAPNRAQAEFIYTAAEVGGDVVVSGSGTIDLDGLTNYGLNTSTAPLIAPNMGFFAGGGSAVVYMYGDISGPSTFGPGGGVSTLIYTGPLVLVDGSNQIFWISSSYVSDTFLSNTATYEGQSFSSLGLTPGTYVYTWGSGADADSLTINVVPEPAVFGMLMMGGAAFFLRRNRR